MSIYLWNVPSVCTGMSHDIREEDFKSIVDYFCRNFFDMSDYALGVWVVTDGDKFAEANHTFFTRVIGANSIKLGNTTIYHCTPIEFYLGLDKWMASPDSKEAGYDNYDYLSGNSDLSPMVCYLDCGRYIIGEDSFNGTNKLQAYEGSLDLDDHYDGDDDYYEEWEEDNFSANVY